MLSTNSKELRFKLYHQLEQTYHKFFDELAKAELTQKETGKIAQTALLSRQEGLKHLVSSDEIDIYFKAYPEEN